MADKKISEMETASVINNDDNLELSHSVNGGFTSVKASILAIATKILTAINFTSALQTTDKTVLGAINEVAQGGGGSSTLDGLTDVEIDDTTLADGQALVYDGTEEKWVNGQSGGGTTVVANPSGTATTDLEKLQVGNDIYSIPSGSGVNVIGKKDILWEYSNSYDITLAHPFTDYDFLVFEGNNYTDNDHRGGAIVSSTELESIRGVSGKQYSFAGVTGDGFANYLVSSTTSIPYDSGGGARVLRVWGIKLGGAYKEIEGTLTAGATSITLSDSAITTSSTFEPFTSIFGVKPTNMVAVAGSVTLTFEAQSTNMDVKVRVS